MICNLGNANRVMTYSMTFPAAGTYQLYARVRVGPNNANDGLFFADATLRSLTAGQQFAPWRVAITDNFIK
jgi:hypothetical protein